MPNRLFALIVLVTLGAARPATAQEGWTYAQAGGVIGGAAFFALTRAGAAACGIGCENDMGVAREIAIAGAGAGIGTLAGFVADVFRGDGDRTFGLSAGPILNHMATESPAMDGSASGAGVEVVAQLSRFVSVHGEYSAMRGTFVARPQTIDTGVLANVVPATSRRAGWSRGLERSRIDGMFSEMIGVHPPFWGRFRFELLAGASVQARENFSYYDADVPGTFKVLNFAAPDLGAVLGGNAEIVVSRHLAVVPMVRYYTGHDAGPSVGYTVGARYRF